MKLTYDPKVDAVYIVFEEGEYEVTSQRLSEDVAVNYSPDGRIIGLEILAAGKNLFENSKEPAIKLENLKAA